MSSVIKLGRSSRINIKVSDNSNYGGYDNETEGEFLRRLEEEKHEQIFNAGREDAIRELKSNYAQNLNKKFLEYDNLMNSIENTLIEYKDSFDKIVIDSTFLIASKVIQRSISDSPIITETIREAIRKIIGANNIVLRLSPSDKALIQETDVDFFDNNSYSNLKFEVDDRIDAGGCLVESEIGNVDARISSQLHELKKALLQEHTSEN
ncbi:MAG: hypothetical protein KKF62_01275 [Bacteroidetes bacterium]|nr:hypothetical protein [Bacteroidota bacterium]MBU1115153.1 hypothetical protein [Bacteroidota bacterium]MBU1799324.1 hypothetical protein [Bacteroidota bacterium]